MRLYRFSPIQNERELREAITHTHFGCNALCHAALNRLLPNAGNMGVFCHYDEEYKQLTTLRKTLTESSDNLDQKYFRLHDPIVIPAKGNVPETVYTHLYIRKPDPYRHHVGDVDFYLPAEDYAALKQSLQDGRIIPGARIFPRNDLDLIELFHPDSDVLGYISTKAMTEKVHIKVPGSSTNL